VPFAHGQQVDSSGTPYSGALLYVYQSGTSTAVDLFSDSVGATTAANPIVGDSSGRIAQRYTTYSGALTLTLKTSAGVTIWTQNDIYPVVHAGGLVYAGNISVEKASATLTLDSSSGDVATIWDRVAGALAYLEARTGGVKRWRGIFANATAESGSNAGSDLVLQAFDDSGNSLGNALAITRSTLAAVFGGALTATGAFVASSTAAITGAITGASSIKSTHATNGVGYGTGAGGAITQATDKSTGVTLNKICGQITMNNATLNAGTEVGFTLTNSAIAATDAVVVNIASGATANSYLVGVDAVAAGSCRITLTNTSAGNLGEALVLNFAVIKAVAA